MRYLGVGMLLLSLCGTAFAQHQGQYWSLGGFGNLPRVAPAISPYKFPRET